MHDDGEKIQFADPVTVLYKPSGAARRCGISVGTLNRWRRNKLIATAEVIRTGRSFLFTEEGLRGGLIASNHYRRNLGVEVLGIGE